MLLPAPMIFALHDRNFLDDEPALDDPVAFSIAAPLFCVRCLGTTCFTPDFAALFLPADFGAIMLPLTIWQSSVAGLHLPEPKKSELTLMACNDDAVYCFGLA